MHARTQYVDPTLRPEVVVLAFVIVALLSTSISSAFVRAPEAAAASAPLPIVAPSGSPSASPVEIAAVAMSTPPPAACPAAPSMAVGDTLVAHAQTANVTVHSTPSGALVRTLVNPTRDHQPLHLRVMEKAGRWYRVQMPERPNSTTGWVLADGMTTSRAEHRILIQRCSRTLTLYQGGKPVFSASVAIGKENTPTPLGDFYVDFTEKWRPSSPYGPWLISVTGFSEVYSTFGNGGVGQIGIHGTQAETSVGKPTSNGCIRMHNEDVTRLASLVVAGTPVLIVD
ncbi:MAG TPA: L,D-transpeptidase [Mycobacteriales bacterium]|nr:L,D-transpeptidase [Mycobacteriales bacterium]